jgi:tyrosinase
VNNPNNYPGYCPHHSNYFPTWHRAYVALFEQVLQQNAIQQVNKFPNGATKQRYMAAATSMRSPYWDWTQNTGGSAFPSLFTNPMVQVTMAQNNRAVKKTIPNPLYQYRFKPNPGQLGDYVS